MGVPVSMVETMDAAEALRYVDLADREALRAALGATMVKNERHQHAFHVAFDVFFGLGARPEPPEAADQNEDEQRPGDGAASGMRGGAGGAGSGEDEALFEAIAGALEAGDEELLRTLVAEAVDRYAGIEPGRPVGGRYYFYRVMRRLDAARLMQRLLGAAVEGADSFEQRIVVEQPSDRVDDLRDQVRREIVRRLVQDRGTRAVARTLRDTLVEDIDLMHATRDELRRVERAVAPLARKLATPLAQRRKRGRKGRLDVRRTIRRSLARGGALLEPRFRPPRLSKPQLVLLCDISGSMATFARFTMQLTYAMGHQFSRVRAFAFIDGIDEVTRFFGPGADFQLGLAGMNSHARVVWRDGHSDYGNALEAFNTLFGGRRHSPVDGHRRRGRPQQLSRTQCGPTRRDRSTCSLVVLAESRGSPLLGYGRLDHVRVRALLPLGLRGTHPAPVGGLRRAGGDAQFPRADDAKGGRLTLPCSSWRPYGRYLL